MEIEAKILIAGQAEGELLKLTEPLGFWGGVSPDTGRIINVRHPQYGAYLGGKIVAIPRLIGSSSSSAVMLELIRNGHAPNALILGNLDAILIVGCLVGRELGYACPAVVQLDSLEIYRLAAVALRVEADGRVNGHGAVHEVHSNH